MSNLRRSQLALKVVERPSYYEGELCPAEELYSSPCHSLHQLCPLPFSVNPAAISAVIHSLSKSEDLILDPFCGSGGVGLEAGLSEREFLLSDTDPVALSIAAAKVRPSDLTEVALWLQMSPLKTPASFDRFDDVFSAFYDAETFRELSALRRLLSGDNDRLSFFLRGLSLGLLHGRGAGNFSVYSPSEKALSVAKQGELNHRRNQFPDYRAIAPRLLRKSAVVLQDGVPSSLFRLDERPRVTRADARDLSHVRTGSVGLVVANLPLPRHAAARGGTWLKRWFLGMKSDKAESPFWSPATWTVRMNEFLTEAARVSRSSGRIAIFCDRRFNDVRDRSGVKDRIVRLVEAELGLYWEPECFLSIPEQKVKVTGKAKSDKAFRFRADPEGVLVLRRK